MEQIIHPVTGISITPGTHRGNVARLGNGEYVIYRDNAGFGLEDEGKWVCLVAGELRGNSIPYETAEEAEEEEAAWRELYPQESITIWQIEADWGQMAIPLSGYTAHTQGTGRGQCAHTERHIIWTP